ncbi:pickpocket protein 28-like isoform X2 [Adelges cooleyi]|uniref:pickpocket protein 28-like isoform X2 n=1 Tax=Adelges cooleyi TaxID=133065 RepID=UPI0021801D54|nr:pickpocket protein 28-like isoform X2 [Adelges cooleyi]
MFESRKNKIIRRHLGPLKTEKPKKSPEKPKNGNYLREFASITSLHGVIYLGEPNRPLLERLFWLCVMSLVLFLSGTQIYLLFKNWMKNRMIMTLDNPKFSVWHFPFPAITFCSDIQLQDLNNRTYKDENLPIHKEFEDTINMICYSYYQRNKNCSMKYINSTTWQHVIERHGITCEERMFMMFWLQDEIKSPCDYFQPIITQNGLCYSLNMIPFQLLYKQNYYQTFSFLNHTQADIISKKTESTWTPDTGFKDNAVPFDTPWRVTGDTNNDAVKLIFKLKIKDDGEYCPLTESGLMIIIHNPSDTPIGLQPSAYTTGNRLLSISMAITYKPTSRSLAKWPPNVRNCYFQHERSLKYFKFYTAHNCEIECRTNKTLQRCGCAAYYQPRFSIFHENFDTPDPIDEDCHCLPDCTDYRYDYDVVKIFRNWTTSNSKLKQSEDVAVTNIYYKRKSVLAAQRTALVPFNELLGNIGGLLGLFLGCSIISVFEIIYFFVIRLYFDRQSQQKIKPTVVT